MVGSSPSGTLATNNPIAKLIAAPQASPASSPSGKNAIPKPTATAAISQATFFTCRSSGLSSRLTRAVNAAMRPSSVCIPVAVTTARPWPPVHTVPLNTTSRASSSGPATSGASAERETGADSPVSVDRSTSRAPAIRRASAQMLSPSATTSTSPGTNALAGTSWSRPSRQTCARAGRNAASASTAFSACTSWKNANAAFKTITAAIAIASEAVPLAQASTPATARTKARGWVTCRTSSAGHCLFPRPASALGP